LVAIENEIQVADLGRSRSRWRFRFGRRRQEAPTERSIQRWMASL